MMLTEIEISDNLEILTGYSTYGTSFWYKNVGSLKDFLKEEENIYKIDYYMSLNKNDSNSKKIQTANI